MVNKILDAITIQLGKTFGTKYKYHVEDVKQGLIKPCFTVDVIIPLERSKRTVLYDRTMPVVIHYFHDSDTDVKKVGFSMAEQVIECLEYLPFQNTTLRGENISWQMVDDVLQIFVTYKFTTTKVVAAEVGMEELSEKVTHN